MKSFNGYLRDFEEQENVEKEKQKRLEIDLIIEKKRCAKSHFIYCNKHCNFFYHDSNCLHLAKTHSYSFVYCKSRYCIERCQEFGFTVSNE